MENFIFCAVDIVNVSEIFLSKTLFLSIQLVPSETIWKLLCKLVLSNVGYTLPSAPTHHLVPQLIWHPNWVDTLLDKRVVYLSTKFQIF